MRQWYLLRHTPSNSDTQDRTKARSCTEAPLAGRDYKTASFSFILVYMVISVVICQSALSKRVGQRLIARLHTQGG